MPSPRLDKAEFRKRYLLQFQDPIFAPLATQLDDIVAAAWDAYRNSRKSPHTQKAGLGYADPDYDLSVDWIDAKAAIDAAQSRHENRTLTPRILLINGSSRSEHTCPGEMSKSHRMVEIARHALEEGGDVEIDILELDRLASEYGRHIHPRRGISDWLKSMELESAGALAEIDRYIGYWKNYAEGHADFDKDEGLQAEIRNAALTLREAVLAKRAGKRISAGANLAQPRQK